jgi:hypothetical protein
MITQIEEPTASYGASSKEKAIMRLLPPKPRLPFLLTASCCVSWLFPMKSNHEEAGQETGAPQSVIQMGKETFNSV